MPEKAIKAEDLIVVHVNADMAVSDFQEKAATPWTVRRR